MGPPTNFAQSLESCLEVKPEADVHPHDATEAGHLFSAIDGSAAELEVLNLLNALVYLYKPSLVLETGTGKGFGTLALASAIQANKFGHLHSVEIEQANVVQAGQTLAKLGVGLVDWVTLHHADSRDFIRSWQGPAFNLVFFDSLIAIRHVELSILLDTGRLAEGALCVFHDTSRARGAYYHDFNPEMIAALDRESAGRQWLECELSRGLRIIRV